MRFDSMEKEIFEILELRQPIELIYFTSSGYSATLTKLSYETKKPAIFVIFDLRIIKDSKDNEDLEEKIKTLLKNNLISTLNKLDIKLDISKDTDFVNILNKFVQQRSLDKDLILIFKHIESGDIYKSQYLGTILVALDELRFQSSSKVNFITTSPYPIDLKKHLSISIRKHYVSVERDSRIILEIDGICDDLKIKKLDEKVKRKLVEAAGGNLGLIKDILRDHKYNKYKLSELAVITPTKTFFTRYNSVVDRLNKIVSSYPERYLEELARIANNEAKMDKEISEVFKSLGVLANSGEIRSSILKEYIKKFARPEKQAKRGQVNSFSYLEVNKFYKVDKNTYEILLNSNPTKTYLSEKEFQIVDLFVKKQNQVVTKDDLASIIWQEKQVESYSEWAIDKTISRIRTKLKDNKRPFKMIKTLKNRGFVFTSD